MLKGIPSIIPPELLKIMLEMGHGDELVIGGRKLPQCKRKQALCKMVTVMGFRNF